MLELNEGERIKNIKMFEGIYAITDGGRVWSYRRKKWLASFDKGKGYQTVRLCFKGNETDITIHRLVGNAFIHNPLNKPYVNHKNGNKSDNHYKNLEWVTSRENIQHACDNKLNSHFKLSKKDKIIICQMYYLCKIRKADIARIFDISASGILYIIKAYGDQVGNA